MLTRELKVLVLGEVPEVHEALERKPFKEELPTCACEVPEADDFSDALERSETYDLVVINIAPYGMDILEQVRELRPACPVLMIGEPNDIDLILRAKRQGLEAYLLRMEEEEGPERFKDLLTQELLTQLRRFVEPPSMKSPSAEEMYRYAQFHNVRQPFFVVASRRYLLYVNKAGQQLISAAQDYTPISGDPFEQWVLEEDADTFEEHLDRAFGGHEVVSTRTFEGLSDDDGAREIYYQPVTDPKGRVVAVTIAVHRPAQPELQRARVMQEITRFASGVGHVNNNLLNIILSNSDLLAAHLEQKGDQVALERVEKLQRGVRRAASFTHQLQAFSRTNVSRRANLDLNAFIDELQEVILSQIGADVDIVLDLALNLRAVRADRNQMELVLVNLAQNAAEAMGGAGKLRIRTRPLRVRLDAVEHPVAAGNYVLLEVSDTGEGIAEELHERIFEPFFTTRRTARHVGLGLATVRATIEHMGGKITVNSAPGEGATFKIYLPTVDELEPESEERPISEEVAEHPAVLVVEDDVDLRTSLTEALELAGYRTYEAASVDEALDIYSEQSEAIKLVLSDVILTSGSGIELAERFYEEDDEVTFVFISGYGPAIMERFANREINAHAFLSKPVDIETLLSTIDELL